MTGTRRPRAAAWRPRLDPGRAAVAFIADEAVILDLADYSVLRANPTAALALRLLDGRRGVPQVGAAVAVAYGVRPAPVIAAVTRWLSDLARRGLVAPGRPRERRR